MPALNVFVPPAPVPSLARFMGSVNHQFLLPRWCRIKDVHLAEDAELALQLDMHTGVPMFFTPNHPEYFADWMLDKWLLDRVAPQMANWADAAVVNGMGGVMQKFWLGNNIIAAVRGDDSTKAIEHSIAWAVAGKGVLLHPEGSVNWDNEAVGPLFPGAARMAVEAAKRHPSGKALLAPLAWYLRFRRDVTNALYAELADLDKRLQIGLPRGNPAQKMMFLVQTLIERVAEQFGMKLNSPRLTTYDPRERLFEVQAHANAATIKHYRLLLDGDPHDSSLAQTVRIARHLRQTRHPLAVQDATMLEALARLDASVLSAATLTQEQVTHRLRRIRQDWVRGTAMDMVAKMAPRGLAARDAVIAVVPRLEVRGGDEPGSVTAALQLAIEAGVQAARGQAQEKFGPGRAYPVR